MLRETIINTRSRVQISISTLNAVVKHMKHLQTRSRSPSQEDHVAQQKSFWSKTLKHSKILSEIHDSPIGGHPGTYLTWDLVNRRYEGPGLRKYTEDYVKGYTLNVKNLK